MQLKSSRQIDGITKFFRQLIDRLSKLATACLCAENCRFCGREIALGFSDNYSADNERASKNEISNITDIFNLSKQENPNSQHDAEISHSSQPVEAGVGPNLIAQAKKLADALCFIREPARRLGVTFTNLGLSATHALLVKPAILYFKNQPSRFARESECLCQLCWDDIEIDLPKLGFVRLANFSQIDLPVASGASYEGKLKDLIRAFKYDGDTTLAGDLASIMSLGWSALNDYMPASNLLLIPVPLHESRKKTRGYNQSELLARELSKIVAIPVAINALTRTRATRPQQVLGKVDRLKNVSNSFVGKEKRLAGKTIILIDDVCTSGSTLAACAEEALRCGALSVVALTIARAILSHDS